MSKKWQLHWSHLSMLWRCGEQYRRRYIEGEIRPPGMALIIGSGTHHGVEADMTVRIDTGVLAPTEQVQEATRDYVDNEFKRGAYWLSPAERAEGKSKQAWRDGAVDMAVGLATCHHEILAPTLVPTSVERKWLVKLDGFPCDLAGRFDIQEGTTRLRDTKTSARSPSASTAEDSDQLTMYAMAAAVIDGKAPGELAMDSLVKTKTPKVVTQITHRDVGDFKVLLRRIEASVKAIEAGVFLPCDRKDWMCSPKWCGFYDSCPYVRDRTVHQVKTVDERQA